MSGTPRASSGEDLGFVHRYEPGTSPSTLLLLHGTGGDENDLMALGRTLAPHASLLSPRGPVLEHGMPRFFRHVAVGVFDEEDLIRRTADLGRFVRDAAARYAFDPARVFALGYSNGANIAAALLLLDGAVLAGAALLRAVLPLTPSSPPSLTGKPVLIVAGQQDPYAPMERVESLVGLLAKAGAVVETQWTDGGHGLEPEDLEAARSWLARHFR